MRFSIRRWLALGLACATLCVGVRAAEPISRDPYIGAVVMDATTGNVLDEENADLPAYPASMVKLMNLLVVLEQVKSGALRLEDPVRITAESAGMGGTQVYLAENEVFSVEELLYALMIASANDAALALALHVAGSREAFVKMMNEAAERLGMKSTKFFSPHGLPPSKGQDPDVSTARDMAMLCRELLTHHDILAYTATKERGFRNDTFRLLSHNPLLTTFDGCDGLKTGYFRLAGFSIAATAQRQGARVIAVVMGSKEKNTRNTKAAEWLSKGFLKIPRA